MFIIDIYLNEFYKINKLHYANTKKYLYAVPILALLVALLFCTESIRYYFFPITFNSYEWKSSFDRSEILGQDGVDSFHEMSNRRKMVYSVIRSGSLVGKDKEYVSLTLGLDNNDFLSQEWLYWLKFTSSDNKWLLIDFDDNGIVALLK